MPAFVDAVLVLGGCVSVFAAGHFLGRRRSGSLLDAAGPRTAPRADVSTDVLSVLELGRGDWAVLDASDRVLHHSPGAEALGLVDETELCHEELRVLVRRARRTRQAEERDIDVPLRRSWAARLDLRVGVTPLSGGVVALVVEDLTQERRIEETRRDFVVNVSHELKTPVGGLRLLAEAVEDAADDPATVARFASRMRIESVRLANLVQEIVDLSRLQGSDTLTTARPVDLATCAERAAEEVRLIAEARGIEILVRRDDTEHEVLGDAGLLTTAVRNLVNNAVNYSDPGTRVDVDVVRSDLDVRVRVSDQGIGMSPQELERVFERFYRVDPARSRQTGGTGLGLAIVKHVCANHGGRVEVRSEPGVGSTFEMQIPARPTVTTDDEAGADDPLRQQPAERKERQ